MNGFIGRDPLPCKIDFARSQRAFDQLRIALFRPASVSPLQEAISSLRAFVERTGLQVWFLERPALERAFKLMDDYADHPWISRTLPWWLPPNRLASGGFSRSIAGIWKAIGSGVGIGVIRWKSFKAAASPFTARSGPITGLYRSVSPSTKSMLPKAAIESAIRMPSSIFGSPCKLPKLGVRMWTR
jgi:hypothetical protein